MGEASIRERFLMEYVIQARFAKSFTSLRPIRELFPNADKMVLFADAFTGPDDISLNQAEKIVEYVLQQSEWRDRHHLYIETESVVGSKGSVIITLFVTTVVLNPSLPTQAVGVVSAIGGIALWAVDKALGGALSEAGKGLVRALQRPIGAEGALVRDPQKRADETAEELARKHGGTALPLSGGVLKDLADGSGKGFEFMYQLLAPRPGYISVVTDMYALRTPEYHVFETAQPGEHS
jgi:hypothetical protein